MINQKNNQNLNTQSSEVRVLKGGFDKAVFRWFKNNLFGWLRKQRMLKAKSLLIRSDLSINEIAVEVGYGNIINFSFAYKKQFNVFPVQQRRLSRIEIVTVQKVYHT
jgi:transcriptional regulator GlxA family with amidase domain